MDPESNIQGRDFRGSDMQTKHLTGILLCLIRMHEEIKIDDDGNVVY